MLSRSDLEYQSLYCYLKEGVLAREFYQEVQNEPLSFDTKSYNGQIPTNYKIIDPINSVFGKKASMDGRGWLSFELSELNPGYIYSPTSSGYVPTYNTPFNNYSFSIPLKRESNYIKVRDQYGNLMDRTWYQLDYKGCRVRYPSPTTPSGVVVSGLTPTSIDYRFHLLSFLDGWPTEENIPELPLVSVYPNSELIGGFQIGPGVEFTRKYTIDIFATSNQERRQIVDILKQSLFNKHVPVIDFNRCGFPLEQHGVINKNFIQTLDYGGNKFDTYLLLNPGNGQILYFFNIEVLYDTSPRGNMATATRHMAKIRFTTCSYSDRDPEVVGKFSGLQEPIGGYDSLMKKAYSA